MSKAQVCKVGTLWAKYRVQIQHTGVLQLFYFDMSVNSAIFADSKKRTVKAYQSIDNGQHRYNNAVTPAFHYALQA